MFDVTLEHLLTFAAAFAIGLVIYHIFGPFIFALLLLIIYILYKMYMHKVRVDESIKTALESSSESEVENEEDVSANEEYDDGISMN